MCVCVGGGGSDRGRESGGGVVEERRKWRDGKVYPMQATGLKGH